MSNRKARSGNKRKQKTLKRQNKKNKHRSKRTNAKENDTPQEVKSKILTQDESANKPESKKGIDRSAWGLNAK